MSDLPDEIEDEKTIEVVPGAESPITQVVQETEAVRRQNSLALQRRASIRQTASEISRSGSLASQTKPGGARRPAKQPSAFARIFCCASRPAPAVVESPITQVRPNNEPRTIPRRQSTLKKPTQPTIAEADKPLLKDPPPQLAGRKCVVIDLDETLVHSSFKPIPNPDYIVPVEIDGTVHQVYVLKRPHVDQFLRRCAELFECILWTASLAKYADPVTDLLEVGPIRCFSERLFRESCTFHEGIYVKDLDRLGRDLKTTLIIDNSPNSYAFHDDNAIPIVSWFDDPHDTELLDLIPFLEDLNKVEDIRAVLEAAR